MLKKTKKWISSDFSEGGCQMSDPMLRSRQWPFGIRPPKKAAKWFFHHFQQFWEENLRWPAKFLFPHPIRLSSARRNSVKKKNETKETAAVPCKSSVVVLWGVSMRILDGRFYVCGKTEERSKNSDAKNNAKRRGNLVCLVQRSVLRSESKVTCSVFRNNKKVSKAHFQAKLKCPPRSPSIIGAKGGSPLAHTVSLSFWNVCQKQRGATAGPHRVTHAPFTLSPFVFIKFILLTWRYFSFGGKNKIF